MAVLFLPNATLHFPSMQIHCSHLKSHSGTFPSGRAKCVLFSVQLEASAEQSGLINVEAAFESSPIFPYHQTGVECSCRAVSFPGSDPSW